MKSIVNISKLNPTSFNDEAYNHLHTKIDELQNIYNIIFRNICHTKNIDSSHQYKNIINHEINSRFRTHRNDICLKKTPGGDCTEAMFETSKLNILIDALYNDRNFNKVCLVRNAVGDYPIEVQIAGSYNLAPDSQQSHEYLLNINKILTETQIKPEEVTYICFQKNNELICKDVTKPRSCDFCEKWVNERNMLRNMFGEMLYTNDPNILFNQMTNTVPLLSAGILDQQVYHKYNTLLNQYKQMKQKRY